MIYLTDPFAIFLVRWLHILNGIMWLGLLWYFNFVQIPAMGRIPDDQKPAITKVIAPSALFWFRWSALGTIVFGLFQAWQLGFLGSALGFGLASGRPRDMMIGFGMWFGLIMAFNAWFVLWPAQQTALGLVDAAPDKRARAARLSLLVARANTMLSIPMTYAMVAGPHLM